MRIQTKCSKCIVLEHSQSLLTKMKDVAPWKPNQIAKWDIFDLQRFWRMERDATIYRDCMNTPKASKVTGDILLKMLFWQLFRWLISVSLLPSILVRTMCASAALRVADWSSLFLTQRCFAVFFAWWMSPNNRIESGLLKAFSVQVSGGPKNTWMRGTSLCTFHSHWSLDSFH